MPTTHIPQLSFASGELDPRLFGRLEIERRESAVARARNVLLDRGGAVKIRPGLRFAWDLEAEARLIGWEHKDGPLLVAVTTDGNAYIYDMDGSLVATLPTFGSALTAAELRRMDWASDATRLAMTFGGTRQIRLIDQAPDDGHFRLRQPQGSAGLLGPYFAFQDRGVTITPSNTTGNITLTTSAAHWDANHMGVVLLYTDDAEGVLPQGYRVSVTSVSSATVANGTVIDTLPGTDPTENWSEWAWSPFRGTPYACCFHQQRLVCGRTDSLPGALFFSETGSADNFVGPATLVEDSPFTALVAAEQGATVRHLRSQGPLIVLTSGAEFIVAEQPVSGTNISIQKQSSQGADEGLRPAEASGSLIFLRADKGTSDVEQPLVNFRFDELRQIYVPDDIGVLGQHLISSPREMVLQAASRFDTSNRVWIVNSDGDLVAIHLPRDDQPGATLLEFASPLEPYSIATVAGRLFLAADFNGDHRVFELDPDHLLDGSVTKTVASGKVTGLNHLEGLTVRTRNTTGDAIAGPFTVDSGEIDVSAALEDSTEVEVGLIYPWQVRTLELEAAPATLGTLKSIIQVSAQLIGSRMVRAKAIYTDDAGNESEVDGGDITRGVNSTGHRRVHLGGWGETAQVDLSGSARPMQLLSLNIDMEF